MPSVSASRLGGIRTTCPTPVAPHRMQPNAHSNCVIMRKQASYEEEKRKQSRKHSAGPRQSAQSSAQHTNGRLLDDDYALRNAGLARPTCVVCRWRCGGVARRVRALWHGPPTARRPWRHAGGACGRAPTAAPARPLGAGVRAQQRPPTQGVLCGGAPGPRARFNGRAGGAAC